MEKIESVIIKQECVSNSIELIKLLVKYYDEVETPYLDSNQHLKEYYNNNYFKYGTSGFRTKSEVLDIVAFRLAIVAYIRSLSLSLPIGVIISASHNTCEDNGFKIADILGKMLNKEWEAVMEKIINSKDFINDVTEQIKTHVKNYNNNDGRIIIGHDNRKSSYHLKDLMIKALNVFNCSFTDYEEVTTPTVHFLTYLNQQQLLDTKKFSDLCKANKKYYQNVNLNYSSNNSIIFPKEIYFDIFKGVMTSFLEISEKLSQLNKYSKDFNFNTENRYQSSIIIDMANGVGGTSFNKEGIVNLLKGLVDVQVTIFIYFKISL